ncbi:MAG: glycine betaine ABC transporter substrate-binding protein [bacterium]|nr:glycine betaine ABC transporter substrate-binding protein [bacterium]
MKSKTVVFMSLCLLLMNIICIDMSLACVGKTIYIGQEKNSESMILAEILAILIRERTGTTAVVKVLEQNEKGHDLLEKGDLDIFVEYTGAALIEVLKKKDFTEKDKIFEVVRQEYQEKLNLVWLKPFGFNSKLVKNEEVKKMGLSCLAAPVIRKDTLKKFPALPRLLDKLGGIIDEKVYEELLKKVDNGSESASDAARGFLKEKKLI